MLAKVHINPFRIKLLFYFAALIVISRSIGSYPYFSLFCLLPWFVAPPRFQIDIFCLPCAMFLNLWCPSWAGLPRKSSGEFWLSKELVVQAASHVPDGPQGGSRAACEGEEIDAPTLLG